MVRIFSCHCTTHTAPATTLHSDLVAVVGPSEEIDEYNDNDHDEGDGGAQQIIVSNGDGTKTVIMPKSLFERNQHLFEFDGTIY